MVASVNDFLAQFQGGGARANRYEVVLTFPNGVGDAATAEKISFTCKAASIPASNLGVATVPYKGRPVKLPGDKTWDDWNITVLLDNDFVGRTVFEIWHDNILGFDSNVAQPGWVNPRNVFATATVTLLDRSDAALNSWQLEGMFPIHVGDVALGYDQNDQVMEQQVSFAINGVSVIDAAGAPITT